MTKIIFNHPPVANPFVNFDPSNKEHYPDENQIGVYILGIKAKVDDELKFIPLVVGEGKLRNRLYKDHYLSKFVTPLINLAEGKFKKIKEKKEIWNFSNSSYKKSELKRIYAEMHTYDKLPRIGKKEKTSITKISGLRNLLYFQNKNFFNCRFGDFRNEHINLQSDEAILYLSELLNDKKYVNNHLDIQKNMFELVLTLKNLCDNFYYVYSNHDILNRTNSNRHFVEVKTKEELNKKGIYTTADSNRPGTESNITELTIDFSKIQNELIYNK
jgi:hypothetical protein